MFHSELINIYPWGKLICWLWISIIALVIHDWLHFFPWIVYLRLSLIGVLCTQNKILYGMKLAFKNGHLSMQWAVAIAWCDFAGHSIRMQCVRYKLTFHKKLMDFSMKLNFQKYSESADLKCQKIIWNHCLANTKCMPTQRGGASGNLVHKTISNEMSLIVTQMERKCCMILSSMGFYYFF